MENDEVDCEIIAIKGAWQNIDSDCLVQAAEKIVELHFNAVKIASVSPISSATISLPVLDWQVSGDEKTTSSSSQAVYNDEELLSFLEASGMTSLPCVVVKCGSTIRYAIEIDDNKLFHNSSEDHSEAWLRKGIEHYEMMEFKKACEYIQQILTHQPHHTQALYNLACIFHTVGYHVLCLGALKRLLLIDGQDHVAHNLLYSILSTHSSPPILTVPPSVPAEHPDENHKHNKLQKEAPCINRAGRIFLIGVSIYQELMEKKGDVQAIMRLSALLSHSPISYLLSLPSISVPPHFKSLHSLHEDVDRYRLTGHEKYVKDVFNALAGDFEQKLTGPLRYQAPWSLHRLITQHLLDRGEAFSAEHSRVLDVGCGSGLYAKVLCNKDRGERDTAVYYEASQEENSLDRLIRYMNSNIGTNVLVGVDLAEKMIEICQELKLYDSLLCGGIRDFLVTLHHSYQISASRFLFDVVLSADTFIYVGILGEIFSLIAQVLRRGGLFGFSVEEIVVADSVISADNIDESSPHDQDSNESICKIKDMIIWEDFEPVLERRKDWGVRLSKAVRYAHSSLYIDLLAERYGFRVVKADREVLRMESNEPIMGIMFLLEKI